MVVLDLIMAVGNCCFPASSGTTALPERYYRLERYYSSRVMVLPPFYQFPSYSYLSVILFVHVCGLRLFLLVVCMFVCVVPGDEVPEHQARRVNPGRASSKRYRTTEPAEGSSSAPPPPQL